MGLFGKKSVTIPEEIINFNVFPPEKEKLLCIGAATTETKHYVDSKTVGSNQHLKLYYPKNRGEKTKQYWLPMFSIQDSTSANKVISSWISNNEYAKTVNPNTQHTVQKEIKKANKIGADISSLLETSSSNLTYGGFDIERLGYMIRVCFSLGMLAEEQAWTYLEQLWESAASHYSSWDEYIVTYMNGQEGLGTNWYSSTIDEYIKLKNDPASLYNKYPLA